MRMGDEEWAKAQDALWTQETDLAAKCEELRQNEDDGVIVPVLYDAAEGLYSDAPAFSGVGKMRLKNIFHRPPVLLRLPGKLLRRRETPSFAFFRELSHILKR